jgi:hypothetical protein
MNQNDNSSTGAFVVSLTFAVVLFTALYIQHKPSNEPVADIEISAVVEEMIPSEPVVIKEVVTTETEVDKKELVTPEPPAVISFAKAFAISRKALGSSQTFTWEGKQYSTNTAEEAEAQATVEQLEIDLTDAQDSLGNTLSLAITPEF